ncbi:MAG: protein translocase subunit SecD [Actinomycetales bacterium]|nr:protein translocase subunit SecD [Actinomycetales bacterium]
MAPVSSSKPSRALIALAVLMIGLGVWAFFPGTSNAVRLGLDLQGGTQVILIPRPVSEGATISDEQLAQTVAIIRQRVDGLGVAEAEVTTQGSGNNAAIIVSVPGANQDRVVDLVQRTALLDFRPVYQLLSPVPTTAQPTPPPAASASPGATDSPDASASLGATAGPVVSASPAVADSSGSPASVASATPSGRSGSLRIGASDAASPAPSATASPSSSPSASQAAPASASPASSQSADVTKIVQSNANDAAFQEAVGKLDCTNPEVYAGGSPDDPTKWLGTCEQNGSAKYILEPAFIKGTNVSSASAVLPQNGVGWVVSLGFDSEGAKALADASTKLSALPECSAGATPCNAFAIVLDGVVTSAPRFNEPILGGQAQIEGNFTAQDANDLANVLKYGALPVTLEAADITTVSATVGNDQLRAGIIAGLLGLGLVGIYLLIYYRVLGIVAVLSLAIAGGVTYATFVVLSKTVGLTLSLAGVAGAIVAIGITADSFIVYFERIRDEIRDGRSLRQACDSGWVRARRTLLAADFVSLLAAIVLYFLSVGSVRGFALVLGLTTLMDIIIAFWFTHPIVVLLGRTRWMQAGSRWTGLDPERVGGASLAGAIIERSKRRGTKEVTS